MVSFNRSTIGVIAGIGSAVGLIVSVIFAIKETPQAMENIESMKKEKEAVGEEIRVVDIAKVAIPSYKKTIISTGTTLGFGLGTTVFNYKTQISLMAASAGLNNYISNYKESAKSIYGQDADDKIEANIGEKRQVRLAYNMWNEDRITFPDHLGEYIDSITGNSVVCYERDILDAEYHFQRNFALSGITNHGTFLDMIGIEHEQSAYDSEWSMSEGYVWIDMDWEYVGDNDYGIPRYEINYIFDPYEVIPWEEYH